MKLAIISHTEHYKDATGVIVGWGPTVNEINHLLEVFDTIYHVAMFYDGVPPPSSLPYISDQIVFVPLPALGGTSVFDKFKILYKSAEVLKIVKDTLSRVDIFQLRTPTGIGVFLIPYLTLFSNKKGWFKYAGNWMQERPPLGYYLQRTLLKRQQRLITINGYWDDQPNNCLSFENPCLTGTDLEEGRRLISHKSIEGKINICFVGRLEKQKGVERIIKALEMLSTTLKLRIGSVHLVGNGPDLNAFKAMVKDSIIDYVFHGFLPRQAVIDIYRKSEIFLLPTTASEGFPKVIAEAMNFGCIPVVSNISSIGHYIKNMETGICLNEISALSLKMSVIKVMELNNHEFHVILQNQRSIVEKFSFSHYNHRIKTEIIS